MTEFKPPISERETEELIKIKYSTTDKWQQEAINQANKELIKRNVTEKYESEIFQKWQQENEEYFRIIQEKLEKNKTESYKIWEIIVLYLFGPIIFIRGYGYYTIFNLRRDNYLLKFKQRIIVFILSFISWAIYINYTSKQSELKRQQEIDKIDITEWEKFHGYK
ncbi:hypothetical protein [Urechidicola croceus]|uniref:Uncharacterized protein n=1 Tax=Urechidicola croceus TaxID=1850246 RepID=A0A1D8P6L3_9FLAO|nr:hypothetical protein [Urechidicola croceus]AOW20177.1 hypothetical protein LPB138_05555 [Urechidicola croceus]